MKSGASESRLRHILAIGREYLTHWVIAGAIIALTGFAPEHWVADLFSHVAVPQTLRDGWLLRTFDFRLGLVAIGVAVIAWDVLRRSRLQKQGAFKDIQIETSHLALPETPSIAVLPFQNMSGDPEQEYFADGMVEDFITGLSRIKWLFVIARNSTFIYKGKAVSVKQVGYELGVRYVLEGSVRKAENRVRITAQLIEAASNTHLWANRYDRSLDDIFALQDEITMHVIGAIEPSLRKAEIDRVQRQRPNNLNAYDLVLRALPLVYAMMPKEAAMAIPLLEDALKLEPNYGAAHAYLSWCLHSRFARGGLREEDRITAIHHAHAAIAHGNDDATTLAVAAFIIALDEHDTTTALTLFERALELSSSNVFALSGSAIVLARMGKTELAIERAQRALRLSPFDLLNWRSNHALAIAYFQTQRFSDAVGAARSAIDTNPSFSRPRAVLAAALIRLGRIEEAKATAQELLKLEPSFTISGRAPMFGLEPLVLQTFIDAWREAGLPE